MIQAGIIGGAGYTGGELIRLLLNHPLVEIDFIYSRSQKGKKISDVHHDLQGEIELKFSSKLNADSDVWFLAMGHGESQQFIMDNKIASSVHLIDLSQDFRLKSPQDKTFIYGLPELNRLQIMNSKYIANPGCFATAIQLAVLPLAVNRLLKNPLHISAITGSTGAGQAPSATTHFSWRSSNISVYKAFRHQHEAEIKRTISKLQKAEEPELNFLPFRGNFTRGILAALYLKTDLSEAEASTLYNKFYEEHPFIHLSTQGVDLKQVVNTNKSLIHLEKKDDTLLITNVIDNLLKGASGQAVQNMNLMFGLEERAGLSLKGTAF